MQRVERERGAVSVVVALLIVALVGFTAIGVDVAATAADRQQLQNGADAAALAIATDCAKDTCGLPTQTAQTMAAANKNDGQVIATVLTPSLSKSTGQVQVQTRSTRNHWFAPVLGIDQTVLTRTATVNWGTPSGGVTKLPLAFSWCEFLDQTGGGLPSGTLERTIHFTKTSGTTCTGPSDNVVPGGFGWVDPAGSTCSGTGDIGDIVWSKTGASVPEPYCTVVDWQKVENQTVLLPIFDDFGGTGDNAWYRIYSFAAFRITGYKFPGQYSWNGSGCPGSCIKGYFTQFVDNTGNFDLDPNAPNLGALVIRLTA